MKINLSRRIVWLDLETTGLKPETDRIIEAGVIVTDPLLREVGRFESLVYLPRLSMDTLDPFIVDMHTKSGLLTRLKEGSQTIPACADVAEDLRSFLQSHGVDQTSYLAGSSVGDFDRQFLRHWMPRAHEIVSRRSINVSTFKAIFDLWAPDLKCPTPADAKDRPHRAILDVEYSIREFKFWLDHQHWLKDSSELQELIRADSFVCVCGADRSVEGWHTPTCEDHNETKARSGAVGGASDPLLLDRAKIGLSPTPKTCDTCEVKGCEYRDDDYNTNGDCLAEK